MRNLLTLIVSLLLATSAGAQLSTKGTVASCTTGELLANTCGVQIIAGQRVWDETLNVSKIYNGSAWVPEAATLDDKTEYFPARLLVADGVQCAAAADTALNSGPTAGAIICADNDASIIYWDMAMPDNWDASSIVVRVQLVSDNADPDADGDIDADLTALCRGNDEAIDNTWASEVAFDTDFDGLAQWDQISDTATITPNGTLNSGDHCYFRYAVDAAGTDATMTDVFYLGMEVGYGIVDFDEVD
jgi:hypothetical protein